MCLYPVVDVWGADVLTDVELPQPTSISDKEISSVMPAEKIERIRSMGPPSLRDVFLNQYMMIRASPARPSILFLCYVMVKGMQNLSQLSHIDIHE